jgi:hypothetical protein
MTAAWAVDLPAGDKLVLLALADCANDEGHCWPGIRSLCTKTGKSERSLQAAIKALCEAQHLTRDEIIGKGCNYLVHPRKDCAPAETAPPQKLQKPPQRLRPTPAKSAGKPSLNRKEPSPKQLRAIPKDWQPVEFATGTESRKVVDGWPPGELPAQLEQFLAHHSSKNNSFSDPQKAWSTWVLNTRKWGIGKHERGDSTLDALSRFQQLCGDVGTSSATGEVSQIGGSGVDGLGRSTGVDCLGGGRA